ncbi:MAG: hypothetical protein JW839_00505 [Candidatus Lokiarchaeota archaeon]|nr:hypothetical protein [Candidatus Lokiarchaeota archaeon]
MAVKPAVKDISVILTNAPQLMIGTKQYPLNFTVMNLRNDVKDVTVEFSSRSLRMDEARFDITLAPQDKKALTVTVSPQKDGALDLAVEVKQKKTIKYTETVLEGHEDDTPQEPSTLAATAPAPVSTSAAPARPTAAPAVQKPAGIPMKPVKPAVVAAPAAVPAVQKPAGAPMKPVKPAGAAATTARPQPAANDDALEKRIMSIKDKYMAARTSIQSLKQGSPEYARTYQEAVKYKEQYERLKAIYESGGTIADAEAAVPSEAVDPIAELKELGQRYTELKNRLAMLSPGSPEHERLKQEAMAVYKEYNDKRNKAKEQGLAA